MSLSRLPSHSQSLPVITSRPARNRKDLDTELLAKALNIAKEQLASKDHEIKNLKDQMSLLTTRAGILEEKINTLSLAAHGLSPSPPPPTTHTDPATAKLITTLTSKVDALQATVISALALLPPPKQSPTSPPAPPVVISPTVNHNITTPMVTPHVSVVTSDVDESSPVAPTLTPVDTLHDTVDHNNVNDEAVSNDDTEWHLSRDILVLLADPLTGTAGTSLIHSTADFLHHKADPSVSLPPLSCRLVLLGLSFPVLDINTVTNPVLPALDLALSTIVNRLLICLALPTIANILNIHLFLLGPLLVRQSQILPYSNSII